MPNPNSHVIAVVVLDGAIPSDFSCPLDIFGGARTSDGKPCYEVKVCGLSKSTQTDYFSITAPHSLRALSSADTIIVPGINNLSTATPQPLVRALQRASSKGVRIASICTGAFLLADAGILDGKTATTHWLAAKDLADRFPQIEVNPNVLFVDNGQVLTSAGAMAAVDLCLHMVRRDFGPVVAAQSARKAVMPLIRSGGQAQFIEHETVVVQTASLDKLLVWVEKNLSKQLDVPRLADQAALSVRTLHRKFAEQTGSTPNAWVLQARIRAAQQMLERASLSIDQIASQTGFGSTVNFRTRFRSIVGISPSAYRNAFSDAA